MNIRPLPPVQQHNFSSVAQANVQRSTFDRSHGYATTGDCSYLIPIFVDEAYPGDTFVCNTTIVSRLLSPLNVPIMDRLKFDVFFFSCPNRLLWDNWVKMQGEQVDPGDSIDYTVPQLTPVTSFASGSLGDYFGLRTGVSNLSVNALPFRMYSKVWNEWFRDQNLQDSLDVPTDDGPDLDSEYSLQLRAKKRDYFSSCLPWPQKGDSVSLPLGTEAPVLGIMKYDTTWNDTSVTGYETGVPGGSTYATASHILHSDNNYKWWFEKEASGNKPYIRADLSSATASTVDELIEAFQLQRLLQRDARGGTRYCEILQSQFGVTDPMHAVLQRTEYIGGGSVNLNVSPVAQTSESGTTDQGHLTAVAYGEGGNIRFTKSFTEHCTLLGLVCLTGSMTYQQGLDRMWNRLTRYDYYMPVLAHLGEQEVLNKEIFAQGTAADDQVFGYQERWAELRCKMSHKTGRLRSDYGSSLDPWHLSPDFAALPVLNSSFVVDETPLDRCVAIPAEHHFILDAWFDLKCTRPMPVFSVPGLDMF